VKGTLARGREVLQSREFRLLFGSRVISQLGDGLFQAVLVASVVFSPEKQSTTVGFAKATALLVVPYSVIGPFAGVFVDRWSRRRILVVTPLVRAAAMLLLLLGDPGSAPFYAGALIALSLNRLFLVTAGTVTPRLVPSEDLLVANSVATVGGTLLTIVGVFAGGLVSDAIGDTPLVIATTALWIAAAVLASAIRTSLAAAFGPGGALHEDLARVGRELADGARRLVHTPRALGPITSYAVDQFLQGLVLVMSFVVFRDRFSQGVGSFSWLVGAGAVGTFVGLATVGFLEPRLSKPRIVSIAFLVSGIPLLLIAPIITGFTVLVGSFFIGVGYAWKKIPIDTMVQQAVPDAFRGRVFAVYDVGQNMARVLAALVAVSVVTPGSVAWDVAACGAAYVLWSPVLPRWVRREPALIVRSYAGGRADEVPRTVVLAGVEESVEVERSWREDRDGQRLLCFRLRLADGTSIDVSRPEHGDRWHLDREVVA